MDTSSKPVAATDGRKAWRVTDVRAKMIFAAKICVMFASFGWIYGNTLARAERS